MYNDPLRLLCRWLDRNFRPQCAAGNSQVRENIQYLREQTAMEQADSIVRSAAAALRKHGPVFACLHAAQMFPRRPGSD